MNFHRGILFSGLALALPHTAVAEDGPGILMEKSVAAMEAERWEEAVILCESAVERYGTGDPRKRYGGQFGAVYYRKGLCEMKLKRWAAALESFRICYRDFPASVDGGNLFQKMALLRSGEAAMAVGDRELAIAQFRKFLVERDPGRDVFPQGVFYINLAVCHYRAGRIPEGNENLEIAIRNKREFPTPDSGIMAGFQVLAETAIAKRDEQALLDFIRKNREGMRSEPSSDAEYPGVFLKLAGDAQAAGLTRAALVLYGMVPAEPSLGEARVLQLAGLALIHESLGNFRGAAAAYRLITLDHPDARNREENFYQLVRLSTRVPGAGQAPARAREFLALFPDSSRGSALREIAGSGAVAEAPISHERVSGARRVELSWEMANAGEAAGRTEQALDAYHTAMIADAGVSAETVRRSLLRVLSIHRSSPHAPGCCQEAAALIRLYDFGLGCGLPMPAEYAGFFKSPEPE